LELAESIIATDDVQFLCYVKQAEWFCKLPFSLQLLFWGLPSSPSGL
jgi:hypothetical protein